MVLRVGVMNILRSENHLNGFPWTRCLGVVFMTVTLPGCSREARKVPDLTQVSRFELISIDGNRYVRMPESYSELDQFHSYPVLGSTVIDSAEERQRLMAALLGGIESYQGPPADCFNPRHGMRLIYPDHQVDYVICFECYQVRVFDGPDQYTELTGDAPRIMFNDILNRSKVPLAPSRN